MDAADRFSVELTGGVPDQMYQKAASITLELFTSDPSLSISCFLEILLASAAAFGFSWLIGRPLPPFGRAETCRFVLVIDR